ncbi:gamma-glutamyl-gamma-aminobutyrate hydrolase family protein [Litchfieldia alkalitelluris]|uniref:gamma-glutamyl-gamma-aminobutyrate hydrolase family protein n=1 Tax=Litchfieldia alkalitelluris TaxID=304268 RepID=UPI0009972048|nr:gamma-glutamyl-gamma-aminobutyrate hydrolase family protein [Litchfieldia alkalitelluris]
MKNKKPVIGITGAYVNHNHYMEGVYVHHDYHKSIAANGGIPIVLPYINENLSIESAELCDGIILSGGEDVDPQFYGQDPHPNLGATIPERDIAEMALVHYAINNNIPLLAICRGVQILNVALGGTLIQDIPAQWANPIKHTQIVERKRDTHFIRIDKDSYLYSIIGEETVRVNSLHHQAIDKLSPHLKTVATASDGMIEAVELIESNTFTIGVQWHPESMSSHNQKMNKLFNHFVENCVKKVQTPA